MDVDFATLERYLTVLSHANRLELLRILREPKTLGEIRLTPSEPQAGESPERTISRQAVQKHLDQLVEAGLVRVRTARRDDRRAQKEYVLDQAQLFAVVEELEKLSNLQARVEPDPYETAPLKESGRGDWPDGPKLVLVHGVHEGRAYPLSRSDLDEPRGWIIGRGPDAHVRLDYDPYVSQENSEIVPTEDGGYELLDLRTSKNGTRLNWRQLAVGGEATLRSGDIVGVGRSLLLFRED